jgi:hypothetical protein
MGLAEKQGQLSDPHANLDWLYKHCQERRHQCALRPARGVLYAAPMGAWGFGPFENDAAVEFLEALRSSSRAVANALRTVTRTPPGNYIEVDEGCAAWAACEVLALAFGYGDTAAQSDNVLELVGKFRPKEDHRLLALEALPRIADSARSEVAALHHEGSDGAQFDTAIEHLRARLCAAKEGPRKLPRPRAGDVITIRAARQSAEFVVVQVTGIGEIAVFEGSCADENAALDAIKTRPARRVPTSANRLLLRDRLLGNLPLRKDIKGKKLYASESGAIDGYLLSAASLRGSRLAPYEEACQYDEYHHHDDEDIRAVATGGQASRRVRSPDEREDALRAQNAEKWTARRLVTTPGPFGDVAFLDWLLQWIEQFGVDNAVQRLYEDAIRLAAPLRISVAPRAM